MAQVHVREQFSHVWPTMAGTALRVAFGLVWVANAALAWTSAFAIHYVGYLHNAAHGQPGWSAWWFDFWIALVAPNAVVVVWLTRAIETALAAALVLGFARRTVYVLGALFSLLVWSTAEGFGGPYTVGATNMGAGIVYVLVFIALIAVSGMGPSPYSIDYYIEDAWPRWRLISGWRSDTVPVTVHPVSWRVRAPALLGIALLVFFLVAGLHSSFNVRPPTPTAAAAAVSPLALASGAPIAKARDAQLPPLKAGPSINVEITATDSTVEIASGVQYQAWTFGGSVPGPVIHVRQGQEVDVTFANKGMMRHSLDFHAAMTPPSLHYVDVEPGKSLTYRFVANVPGAFVYHCGTPPVGLHMANGMYGALIVDPAAPLPPASESYVLVQGEWYTQQVSGKLMGADFQKMTAERPDEVVFNGAAFQYRDHPLPVAPGKRVRIYFVDAGPNLFDSFHVIGAIFDKVYPDGDAAHALSGVSTYLVGPGAGAVFDLVIPGAGKYAFVDHDMAHMMLGAQGVLAVGTQTEAAPPPPIATASVAPAANPGAPSGPYKFDPVRGASLFTANCSACHQATGMGLPGAFPPLKDDPAVLDPDPTRQVETILHGLQGKTIGGVVYQTPMPAFAGTLSDADIADIANHERTSWGNRGKPLTADRVKTVRAKSSSR